MEDGELKAIDFGAGVWMEEGKDMIELHTCDGTLEFYTPEQLGAVPEVWCDHLVLVFLRIMVDNNEFSPAPCCGWQS